jgi:uncharacterized protein (TIGR03790 family)
MMRSFRRTLAILFFLLIATSVRAGLTADNLLLIVNKNAPDGQKLAEYYAQQRQVPDGRIVVLDLPTGDEIDADSFDEKIVVPIRQFLTDNHLQKQVTCLVTFYGVPLRIPARVNSSDLRAEIVSLRKQEREAGKQGEALVASLEKLALDNDPTFKPLQFAPADRVDPAEALPRRAEFAAKAFVATLGAMPPDEARAVQEARFKAISEQFRGPVNITEPPAPAMTLQPSKAPATNETFTHQELTDRMAELSLHRGDPEARRAFRDFCRDHAGVLLFMQVLSAQEQYLAPDESDAAVDNELAAMWWGLYPRFRWQGNPLNYKYPDPSNKPTMMVTRLDAGRPDQVRAIIDTSIKIEREGIKGQIVLDSRGIAPQSPNGKVDAYGVYDQTIRNLATLVRSKTSLTLLADDRPELIAPGTAKDCAVYCGWYSPGKFVASVGLAPGAVAVHIASFEMTTLHGQTTDWCRNLIDTGAVATFGPVAEPYLHAFPPADEFFGLLVTGKLTLAETYWATNPLISWKMAIVGDPLYTPYKTNPALKFQDLPFAMQKLFVDQKPPGGP